MVLQFVLYNVLGQTPMSSNSTSATPVSPPDATPPAKAPELEPASPPAPIPTHAKALVPTPSPFLARAKALAPTPAPSSVLTKTYLAIDYGTVRVGLAVGRAGFAEPLKIISNSENLIKELLDVLSDVQPDQIVIGISEQKMAELTKSFAVELAKVTSLPIIFADETLSSKTVHDKLRVSKKKTRTGHIDHFAAAQFLQEWLDINEQ